MNRTIADFLGRYTLSRVIEDKAAGQSLRFSGTALISPIPSGAAYHENGVMVLASGQELRSERRYRWADLDGAVHVDFDDGRPFHTFDPEHGGLASEHLCGEDMYRGGYDVSAWPNWTVTWNVRGPRKEYRSVTQYTPIR